MARLIVWHGQPFAYLVESPEGDYLVPPMVLNEDGELVEGHEVAEAIVRANVSMDWPVIRDANPAFLAEIDRRMAHLSDLFGVPIGPPSDA